MGGMMGYWNAMQRIIDAARQREDEKAEEAQAARTKAFAESARYIASYGREFDYVFPAERSGDAA